MPSPPPPATTSKGEITINDTSTCHFETAGGCTAQVHPRELHGDLRRDLHRHGDEHLHRHLPDQVQHRVREAARHLRLQGLLQDRLRGRRAPRPAPAAAARRECSASCDTKCTEKCSVHPGHRLHDEVRRTAAPAPAPSRRTSSATWTARARSPGGCTTKCSQPTGGLFCDGQYIDISAVTDCNFSFNVNASGQLTGNATSSCAASPGPASPFGLPAGLAAVAGLALVVARRRRRA